MYSLNIPVSQIRTKTRQEFERHRYVQQLQTVDVLLQQSNAEFQVRFPQNEGGSGCAGSFGMMGQFGRELHGLCWLILRLQETLNYWKQLSHVLKYFKVEEEPKSKLPNNFITGFLEVSINELAKLLPVYARTIPEHGHEVLNFYHRVATRFPFTSSKLYKCKYQDFSFPFRCSPCRSTCVAMPPFAPKRRAMLSKGLFALHAVFDIAKSASLLRVELVTRDGELVNDDVAELCQVVQTLLQHVVHANVVCPARQPSTPCFYHGASTNRMSECGGSSWLRRGGESSNRRTQPRDCRLV